MHLPDPHTPDTAEPREGGQAMVEFALVLPVLCLILFAVLQFGTAFWQYQQLSAGASEGARKAAVSRSLSNRDAVITDTVKNAAPNLTPGNIGVSVSSTWGGGDPVTVTATYPINLQILGVTYFNKSLTSVRTARVEQ